jgi:hypothetical protein
MITDVLPFSSMKKSFDLASAFEPATAITQTTAPEITRAITSRRRVSLILGVVDNP